MQAVLKVETSGKFRVAVKTYANIDLRGQKCRVGMIYVCTIIFVFSKYSLVRTTFCLIAIISRSGLWTVEVRKTDKFSLHIRPSLQDFDKLYDRLIAYLIFEIHFNTRCYYLKIDFEDFYQIVAILKMSF